MGNLGPSAALAGYVLFLFKWARHSWIDPRLDFAHTAIAIRVQPLTGGANLRHPQPAP